MARPVTPRRPTMPDWLTVQRACVTAELPADADFAAWLQAAFAACGRGGGLTLRIVDAEEGRQLNRDYRGRDRPTNVLAFPLTPPPPLTADYLGDLALCAPVVVQEAATQAKLAQAHWAHLTVHGALHLLGYDHQEPEEAARMEQMERRVLATCGFDDPYKDE